MFAAMAKRRSSSMSPAAADSDARDDASDTDEVPETPSKVQVVDFMPKHGAAGLYLSPFAYKHGDGDSGSDSSLLTPSSRTSFHTSPDTSSSEKSYDDVDVTLTAALPVPSPTQALNDEEPKRGQHLNRRKLGSLSMICYQTLVMVLLQGILASYWTGSPHLRYAATIAIGILVSIVTETAIVIAEGETIALGSKARFVVAIALKPFDFVLYVMGRMVGYVVGNLLKGFADGLSG